MFIHIHALYVCVCVYRATAMCCFHKATPNSHPLTPDINVGCVCFYEPVNPVVCLSWSPHISTPGKTETSSVSRKPSAAKSILVLLQGLRYPIITVICACFVLLYHVHANTCLANGSIWTHANTQARTFLQHRMFP